MPDNQLDFSDIPEATTEQLRRARRVGRPVTGNAKQLIAIRIAPRLLARLRRLAARQSKPYQTLIHELLDGFKKKPFEKLSRSRQTIQNCSAGPFTLSLWITPDSG